MKITFIKGPHHEQAIQKCYDYLLKIHRKKLQEETQKQTTRPLRLGSVRF